MLSFTNVTNANATWLDRESPPVDHDLTVSDIKIGKRDDDNKTALDHTINRILRFGIPIILLVFFICSIIHRYRRLRKQRERLNASKEQMDFI